MIIEIREQAREDLQLGFRFYEEQAPGLGRHFLECLFADIESLTRFAGVHETVDGFKRLLSKRFPFAIYYTVAGDRVRVSAILDCRRDPFWIERRLRQAGDYGFINADPRVTPSKPMNDAESEAAVRAERPWLLERRQAGERAAAEATVSGRLRRAVKAMRQPYVQICQATGIPFEQLANFMAGGCYGINWPDIDEDLSAERLLRGAAQASNSVAMRIPGKRVKRTRSIQTVQLIVAVGTETVIPPSDAAEPCLDSATVEGLRDVHQRAKAGDIAWLQERGKVYQLIEATS